MNAIRVLKNEHEQILLRFAKMSRQDTEALREREGLFREIRESLEAHIRVEEKLLFPACQENEYLKHVIRECLETHHLISKLLIEVSRYELEAEEWIAGFGALRDLVEEHFENEEKDLFPEVERFLSLAALNRMAEDIALEQMKSRLSEEKSWDIIMHAEGHSVP